MESVVSAGTSSCFLDVFFVCCYCLSGSKKKQVVVRVFVAHEGFFNLIKTYSYQIQQNKSSELW